MLRKITFLALLCAMFSASLSAQNYVVSVHGIVCELCSLGVAKKLRKLSFVDPSKYDEGVRVDINNQLVYLAVRQDAALDKTVLFDAIEAGGYQPIEIWAIDAAGDKLEVSQ